MPLYTVTMKNGNTFQVRADSKESARRQAISKAGHATGLGADAAGRSTAVTPASVKTNK